MKNYNYLDTKGYECPIPVLKASKFIKKFKRKSKFHIESAVSYTHLTLPTTPYV